MKKNYELLKKHEKEKEYNVDKGLSCSLFCD